MTADPAEHGHRANAWRYGEGTMWAQDEVWIGAGNEVTPVEDLEPDHIANIIRRVERGSNAAELHETPLMRHLRQLNDQ